MGRTFASVTDNGCKCGSLERDAHDPDSPIIFDNELNEYQFEYTVGDKGKAKMTIYHCPFCGGAAPESLRGNLFTVIPDEEETRLRELTAHICTLNDAIALLGLPDADYLDGVGMETPEIDTQGHTIQKYRMLRYENLSKIAIVDIIDFHKDRVHFIFHGKYIGTKKEC